MNNIDKYSTILISRSEFIETGRDIAILRLNEFYNQPGQLVMVRYYTDNNHTKIDTVIAIGIKSGIGEDCYRVITLAGGNIVRGVTKKLPDVSALTHGELYLYEDENEIWNFVYAVGNIRQIDKIIGGPYAFECIEDGRTWYYVDGKLRRDDDFYTREELDSQIGNIGTVIKDIKKAIEDIKKEQEEQNKLLNDLDKEVFPLNLNIINETGTLFLTGTTKNITLKISTERKGKDMTKNCIYYLNEDPILLNNSGRYTKTGLKESTKLTVTATYPDLELRTSKSTDIYFGYNYYYGLIPVNGWEIIEENITKLNKKLSTKNNISFTVNLGFDYRIAFACPVIYGEIKSIKDNNNLENINDYARFEANVNGFDYYVYIKQSIVRIDNYLQIFNY